MQASRLQAPERDRRAAERQPRPDVESGLGSPLRRRRRLAPYGIPDIAVQIGLWVAYGLAYEAVRGSAGRDAAQAFRNGRSLIGIEQRLHLLFEPGLQRLVRGTAVAVLVRWSYWASEFAILVLALAWAYFRDHDGYRRFRDAVIVANTLGLIGYLLLPTAPPRLFRGYGFVNSLSGEPRPGHATGLIGFAANPYAAMPSIHAADALLVGLFLLLLVRSPALRLLWVLWTPWVWFTVLASGNHFWLDVAAGALVAAVSLAASAGLDSRRRRRAWERDADRLGAARQELLTPRPRRRRA